jgi:cell cycle arrest protein BUB3
MHDPRSGTPSSTRFIPQPERVYNMDAAQNTVVVAMAGRKINIYDLRRMDRPTQERESSLRFMTRALACNPDGEGMYSPQVTHSFGVERLDCR